VNINMAKSVSEYIRMLKSLLPKGKAWNIESDSVMHQYLYACAEEMVRLEESRDSLFLERDTRYTSELIAQHEEDFGLPDECTDQAATLSERRLALNTKLKAHGGQHKQYYIDLADDYGYEIAIEEFTPFICGLGECGDMCGDELVIFVWKVVITYTGGTLVYFTSGSSVSGDTLIRAAGIDTLVCLLNKYKPAHTQLIYELDGYEFSSAFGISFDAYPSNLDDYLYGSYNREFSNAFDVMYGGDFSKDEFSLAFFMPA